MDRELKGKIAVITGGANGIGFSIANNFLKAGAKFAILIDIDETEGTNAVKKLTSQYEDKKAVFIKCNVTKDLEEVSKKIIDDVKKVDILVNCAGVLDELNPRKVIEINTTALVEWSMKFFEHMRIDKGGKGGTIINMGSIYSFMVDPYMIFYKTSKYAVMGFSRTLGHEKNFKMFGVRVIIMCPGITVTNMTTIIKPWVEHEDEFQAMIKSFPSQQPDDVGQAAVDIFRSANSGTAWTIVGGQLEQYYIEK